MASMVLAKVGGAGSFAILSSSARFSFIAASRAGSKSATATLSKGGTPPYDPVQAASNAGPFAAGAIRAESATEPAEYTAAGLLMGRAHAIASSAATRVNARDRRIEADMGTGGVKGHTTIVSGDPPIPPPRRRLRLAEPRHLPAQEHLDGLTSARVHPVVVHEVDRARVR